MLYKYYCVAFHQTTLAQELKFLTNRFSNIKEELHPLKPKLGILCVLFQNYKHFFEK